MAEAPVTPEQMKQLKPVAPLHAYSRIFALGEDRVALLNALLMSEVETFESIIFIVKDDWKCFTDVSYSALRRQLYRYKRDFIVPKQAKMLAKLTDNAAINKLAKVTAQVQSSVDAIGTLEKALRMQVRRTKRMQEKEEHNGVHLPDQTNNLYLVMNMAKELAKLQMDVGILKKVPKKIALSASLTEEEIKFAERAAAHTTEVDATAAALKYMIQHKILKAADQTVEVGNQLPAAPMAQTTSADVATDIQVNAGDNKADP